MNENDAISVIENLIETCKDGQKGYQDAASHVKRSDLKHFPTSRARSARALPANSKAELIRLGKPDKKASGSVSASLHRAWIDTKVSLGAGDKAILESVEAGEGNAKESYQKGSDC